MLEMLLKYGLIEAACIAGDEFDVEEEGSRRRLSPEQVLDEYGDRIAAMVSAVMEHSENTTTDVSVPVSAPGGAVPYIADVGVRVVEYQRFWR